MRRTLFAAAIVLGIALAYVDSRPGWDDAGVTAGLLFVVTATLGAAAPQRPWVWALCVGIWIPVLSIFTQSNYGSLMALAFAFAGAYGGMWLRRMVIPA